MITKPLLFQFVKPQQLINALRALHFHNSKWIIVVKILNIAEIKQCYMLLILLNISQHQAFTMILTLLAFTQLPQIILVKARIKKFKYFTIITLLQGCIWGMDQTLKLPKI